MVVDYFTRWPMVRKTKSAELEEITKFINQIQKIMGTIRAIIVDNGGAVKGDKSTNFFT